VPLEGAGQLGRPARHTTLEKLPPIPPMVVECLK